MKKIAYDSLKLDQLKIVEDSKCCLKVNAVITKEGVYPYPDGRAFKSRMELLKAANTIRYAGAKLVLLDHPDSMVVMSQKQVAGGIEKPFFDRDKIRAVLNFDKARCSKDFLQKIRKGALKDVSIGFYYQPDFTPGTWNGKNYDYVMRDIVIDHVAAGVLKGRCSFPSCGIGVDSMMRRISFVEDKVVKRGEKWCVIHCHGPKAGQAIKCFTSKAEAEAMHRAIQAQKGKSSADTMIALSRFMNFAKIDEATAFLVFGDNGRPPKDWWDFCTGKAKSFADDPSAFCGWLWSSGPTELKQSFGGSSVQNKGGKKTMSVPDAGETTESEFQKCVRERMELGYSEAEAKDLCMAYAAPEDEPAVPATTKPEDVGTTGDQEAFDKCVNDKMAEGMSKEEAEKACRVEQPVGEGDQEVEQTELERCITNKVDEGMSADEAKDWCEAEQAGEHQSVDTLIKRSQQLLRLKEQREIERQRAARRHPL